MWQHGFVTFWFDILNQLSNLIKTKSFRYGLKSSCAAFTLTKLSNYDYHVLEDVVRSRCSRGKIAMSAVLERKGLGVVKSIACSPWTHDDIGMSAILS